MKAREIKGFPPALCSRALNGQHNFANMFAGLHAPMRIGGLFQRECAVDQGFDAAPAPTRGIPLASIAAPIAALSVLLRGRSVEPVWCSLFTISLAKLTVALGPPRNAIWTTRPSIAAAS